MATSSLWNALMPLLTPPNLNHSSLSIGFNTIWGNIGSPNHYVSHMVKCFTNMLGMSFKTYPTIGSTILMYTYLCTYLGSSPKLVLHKGFLIPCTKAQNDQWKQWNVPQNWSSKFGHVHKLNRKIMTCPKMQFNLVTSNWNWYMGDFLECFVWSSMDHSKDNLKNNCLLIFKPNYISFLITTSFFFPIHQHGY
jgi:hypothetical protein